MVDKKTTDKVELSESMVIAGASRTRGGREVKAKWERAGPS